MARPRLHPVGTTASDRARAALARLEANGGARKTFALSARAVESLAIIRRFCGDATDTALVERILEGERMRVLQSDAEPPAPA